MTRNEKTNPISIPFDSPRRQLLNPRTAVRWVQCTECIEKTNPIYTHKHPQKHLPTVLKNPVILSEKQTQFDGSPGSDRSNGNAKQTQFPPSILHRDLIVDSKEFFSWRLFARLTPPKYPQPHPHFPRRVVALRRRNPDPTPPNHPKTPNNSPLCALQTTQE